MCKTAALPTELFVQEVGVTGIEPVISRSRTERDTTSLHPDVIVLLGRSFTDIHTGPGSPPVYAGLYGSHLTCRQRPEYDCTSSSRASRRPAHEPLVRFSYPSGRNRTDEVTRMKDAARTHWAEGC